MSLSKRQRILISSMGRSGSTWLTNLLSLDRHFQVVFEPFFPAKVKEAVPFGYYRYLTKEVKSVELLEAASKIFDGKVKNNWTKRDYSGEGEGLMIKSIRANLMISWVNHHFPDIKTILLVRDPFQVASSWERLGWGKIPFSDSTDLEVILNQTQLINDYPKLTQIRKSINLKNSFEAVILEWCILNYIPLIQLKNGLSSFLLVNYNDLVSNPETVLIKIFNFLELDFDNNVLDGISRPSSTSIEQQKKPIEIDLMLKEKCNKLISCFQEVDLQRFISQ